MKAQNLSLKNTVTDGDVEYILSLRKAFEVQKRRLELVETALVEAEDGIIARIESGAAVVSTHSVGLRAVERRNVPWKSQFVELAGTESAEAVLASTTPTITLRLLIE